MTPKREVIFVGFVYGLAAAVAVLAVARAVVRWWIVNYPN